MRERLATAGLIDRQRAVSFRFDGKPYRGYAGDTLASALLASGVRLFGRSFKYHRPRGVVTAGSEEPNALVELDDGARREPNTRATSIELFDGLQATSQNRWPSLAFDLASINSLLSPLLVAGFYYKTFMWPASFWEKLYEPAIRRAAGLGRAPTGPDPGRYEKANAFCDVLVIGAGPAGLAAALSAGRAGARVILCDEDFVLGGRLNAERREIDGMSGVEWARRIVAELEGLPEVRILPRTMVFGLYDGNSSGGRCFGALERVAGPARAPRAEDIRQRMWRIIAKRAVLATGACERPIVFGGNDRPGVMMSSAVRTYANRFGVAAGQRVAFFTATDSAWQAAFDLQKAGVAVTAILDARREVAPDLARRARQFDIRVELNACVTRTRGLQALSQIDIRDGKGQLATLRADTLGMSGGWNPNLGLVTHLGARPKWCENISAFVPDDVPPGLTVVGAAKGSFSLADALREGSAAGADAAVATGFSGARSERWQSDEESSVVSPMWEVRPSRGKAFVDFQHDVTVEDISLAWREGFRSAELMKRYTTLGMATDQGKTSNLNGNAIMAALAGRTVAELGIPTSRPPYSPVSIGALAGSHRGPHFRPTRETPAHLWATERGATFIDTGLWMRARWFAQPGERDWTETVEREARTVRNAVGVCDVSTLGKIDVQGAHAAEFLDRIYINTLSTLRVGRVRYGLMLREDGFAFDDGTVARLSPNHYLMSTTSAKAALVFQHLEHARQVRWPGLDLSLVPVTEHWGQFAIAGPKSRLLLERLLGAALDVSNESFPHLACAEFSWDGVPARLFRVSFSGELGYELAVPARYADAVVRAVMAAGEELGVTPYGLEAMDVLRVEKGHVAGNEINGTTTAGDLGFGELMSKKKEFVGRVLATRAGLVDPGRCVLVGLKVSSGRLNAGAHLLPEGAAESLENDHGYVTSAAISPMLGGWLGLGFLKDGRRRLGERIRVYDPARGASTTAEVTAPAFFDPQGLRLRN